MQITAIKTHKITSADTNILAILDKYLDSVPEKSVVAVTSKIVSITEGRVVKVGEADKDTLVKQEAEFYLPKVNRYDFFLTIKNGTLIASSGIDESNGNGFYVLWPEDPQASANAIRKYLQEKFNLKDIGVIITDSKVTPLRRGVTGFALAHSGFIALKNYIGTPDIFGKKFEATNINIMDGLAASAVFAMGEGREQTPLAIIEKIPFIQFQDHDPTEAELAELHIEVDDDLYAPLLKSVQWKKGKSS